MILIPGLPEPKIKQLVKEKITLSDLKDWTFTGTIWTPNKFDYGFIYRMYPKCIGHIDIKDGDIRWVKGNLFLFDPKNHTLSFYHGGRSPASASDEVDYDYERMSDFLDISLI